MPLDLPASSPTAAAPDPAAQAVTEALTARLSADIQACAGWIPFELWMQRALYEPGLGYYSGPLRKFGADGDFTTAPELSPFFAACVARQVSQWFGHCAPVVVEFGAGSGVLAAGLIQALHALGTPVQRYAIVEVSASLRERQRETLASLPAGLADCVQWLDRLPDRIDGVVLGNELLDAMPVCLFESEGAQVHELGVALDPSGRFEWRAQPAGSSVQEAVSGLQPLFRGAEGGGVGRYRSEIGFQAQAWVRTVGQALERGAMLLIDYGFPAREYYHPQRAQGTLMAHRRHRAHPDVLADPGLQDVTAHVDFSAVAQAGAEVGLDLLGYTSQARFLINGGILELLAPSAQDAARTVAGVRQLGAVQTLLSEAEMGELFKVIAMGRGLPDEACGFVRGDRRGAL
jgi:SAM-dependent MidA family methyltransferase